MKFTMIFICCLLSLSSVAQEKKSDLDFLQGVWKVSDKEVYEEWLKLEDGNFGGDAYTFVDGTKIIAEVLLISFEDDKVIYEAVIKGQASEQTIPFTLSKIDDVTFSFENLENKFPKKIIYHKRSDDELLVEVKGKKNEGFSYILMRQKP